MATRLEAEAIIKQADFPYKSELLEILFPSVRVTASRCPISELPLGASRMGGVPDMPESLEWPVWNIPEDSTYRLNSSLSQGKVPLDLLAQINLKELRGFVGAEDLPNSGWLYFFYATESQVWGFDPKDKGSSCVLYYDGSLDTLKRRIPPKLSQEEYFSCLLNFAEDWTLPNDFNPEGKPLSDSQSDNYAEMLEELTGNSEIKHRLLGFPWLIQGEMELECQLVTNGIYCGNASGYRSEEARQLAEGAADWRLLMQIDSDEDNPGWMWGDSGSVYFWIKDQDLRAKNFADTWLILQCY